jgi:hypothetical protein
MDWTISMDKDNSMDPRCPLGLKVLPTSVCPLAVERLRALENGAGNVSHLHEDKLPGCTWAINDKDSSYCFFKYIRDNKGVSHDTIHIGQKLLITQAAVYSGLNRAIERTKECGILEIINRDEEDGG